LNEGREFFCDLVMVEGKDDIAEIEEDNFNHNPSHPPFRKGRRQESPPSLLFAKGGVGGITFNFTFSFGKATMGRGGFSLPFGRPTHMVDDRTRVIF
jgi:hypothetical protein